MSIVKSLDTLHGQAHIFGTRIPVYMILSVLSENINDSVSDIVCTIYPNLTDRDIQDCLDYAAELVENEYHDMNTC